MAEGLSHKLNEYLRNGQTNDEMNSVDFPSQVDVNHDDGIKKNWDQQRHQNHDRRSSLTSFADLYERAVRNVLNIRPLFDSPLDIFAQRRSDGNNQSTYPQQQYPARKPRPENGFQHESNNQEKDNPERHSSEIRISQPEYIHGGHNESASRFFTNVLSEQMRHSHSSSRDYQPLSQMPNFRGDPGKIPTQGNSSTGNQLGQTRNATFYDQGPEGYRRYWSRYAGPNYRHKPGMLDSMKHPPRHHIEFQTHESLNNVNETVTNKTQIKQDDENQQIQTVNKTNESNDYKPLTEAEMENFKAKIRENARLKYRPYSLRSKKNGMRKKFASGKKKNNKNKKQMKSRLAWKPESNQELFLFNLGLMRKFNETNVNLNCGEIGAQKGHV